MRHANNGTAISAIVLTFDRNHKYYFNVIAFSMSHTMYARQYNEMRYSVFEEESISHNKNGQIRWSWTK